MGLFWAAFLALVVWAVSRLFAPAKVASDFDLGADDLDLRLARGQLDLNQYQALREELTSAERH